MSMTKKDYELIAESIKESTTDTDDFNLSSEQTDAIADYAHHLITNLMSVFIAENPKFDRDKFLKACGVDNG